MSGEIAKGICPNMSSSLPTSGSFSECGRVPRSKGNLDDFGNNLLDRNLLISRYLQVDAKEEIRCFDADTGFREETVPRREAARQHPVGKSFLSHLDQE